MAHGWPWLCAAAFETCFYFKLGALQYSSNLCWLPHGQSQCDDEGDDICDARTSIQSRAISLSLFCINSKSRKNYAYFPRPFLNISLILHWWWLVMWYVWPFLCSRLKPAHVSLPTWGLTGANGNGYAAEKWCPSFYRQRVWSYFF